MTDHKPAEHKFLKFILTTKAFESIKSKTKKWLMECPCGHKRDFWDAGGVRGGGFGEPRKYYLCPACQKGTWHKIRRKTEEESKTI